MEENYLPPSEEPPEEPVDKVDQTARDVFGIPCLFPIQRMVIQNILDAARSAKEDRQDYRRSQIILLPTGAGKSLCFMLPAVLLEGITLIIFPLLSLMADQKRRIEESGMEAVVLRGGMSREDRNRSYEQLESGKVRFLLTNPETLGVPAVLKRLKTLNLIHLVIDEAHIIAEWGDSFRPAYLKLEEIYETLQVPLVSAFTATATEHIVQRITSVLFKNRSPHLISQNPDRTNISYYTYPTLAGERALVRLLSPGKNYQSTEGPPLPVQRPALVFCRSRTAAELSARILREGLKESEIFFYHAGLSRQEKKKIETSFFTSENGILCSTCAYGMGVDKKNIRTVIHRYLPVSITAFLQESGRAGRDRKPSVSIVLMTPEDRPGPEATAEHRALYKTFAEGSTCRRERLLKLMKMEMEVCSGCDVCMKRALSRPPEAELIREIIGRHPRQFTRSLLIPFLRGWHSSEITSKGFQKYSDFGLLKHWSAEQIEEVIRSAVHEKILVKDKKGRLRKRSERGRFPGGIKKRDLSRSLDVPGGNR